MRDIDHNKTFGDLPVFARSCGKTVDIDGNATHWHSGDQGISLFDYTAIKFMAALMLTPVAMPDEKRLMYYETLAKQATLAATVMILELTRINKM